MGRQLTERALLEVMARRMGSRRTTALLGVAFVAQMLGVEDHYAFVNMSFGSIPSRYRWLDEFRELRGYLIEEGFDVSGVSDDLPFTLVAIAAADQ